MADKKRQHYVPRFYLRNFSIGESGKAIGIFNIHSGLYVPSGKLRTQAYGTYFYGADTAFEDRLGIFEGRTAPIIAEILRGNRLPAALSQDHHALLAFTVLQHSRTAYAAEEQNELIDKLVKAVFAKDPRLEVDLDDFCVRFTNSTRRTLVLAARCLPLAFDLKFKLMLNISVLPFITSDNPVVFYNQFLEPRKTEGATTGLACKGLQIFLPLSPTHCVVFYDRDVYKVGSRRAVPVELASVSEICAINRLQCINALNSVYFNDSISEAQVRTAVGGAMRFRRSTKAKVDEYVGPTDAEGMHSLLRFHRSEVRCKLQLGFIKALKKAKKYELGNRVVHVRNEELCRLHEEFLGLVDRQQYKVSDFASFLKDHRLAFERKTAEDEAGD